MFRWARTNSVTHRNLQAKEQKVEVALEDVVIQQSKAFKMKNPDSFTVHSEQLDSNT